MAALAEFSESLSPEEERGGPEPEEELSKAEQEIAALVEQVGTWASGGCRRTWMVEGLVGPRSPEV